VPGKPTATITLTEACMHVCTEVCFRKRFPEIHACDEETGKLASGERHPSALTNPPKHATF